MDERSQNAILEHRTIFNGYQFQWLWISRCTVHLGSRLRHSRSALPHVTYYVSFPIFRRTGRCMARCQGQVYLTSGVACVGSGGGAMPSKTALWRKKASFGTHFVIMSTRSSVSSLVRIVRPSQVFRSYVYMWYSSGSCTCAAGPFKNVGECMAKQRRTNRILRRDLSEVIM